MKSNRLDVNTQAHLQHPLEHMVVWCLLILLVSCSVSGSCPCISCGPAICKTICKAECYECCRCCFMFENRVGKRMSTNTDSSRHICLYETKSSVDSNSIKKRSDEQLSLRLDILRQSQRNLSTRSRNRLLDMIENSVTERSQET